MNIIKELENYQVALLTKELAKENISEIFKLVNQIPLVDYTNEQILAGKKDDQIFYGKWKHSLIMFDKLKPIGVILSFERKSEKTELYPENSIYISEFAISSDYQRQGLGRKLFETFLNYSSKIGFKYLEDKLSFSLQTNSEDFNKHIIDLYKSFGFKERATKQYDNRLDFILGFYPE